MATLPESVDYTDEDFDALRAQLIALVKNVFPDWTDFDVASFGNLLVELYAFVGDVVLADPLIVDDSLCAPMCPGPVGHRTIDHCVGSDRCPRVARGGRTAGT